MNTTMKFVDFYTYCKTCKYEKQDEGEDPCNECLATPAREETRKPERWEKKGVGQK